MGGVELTEEDLDAIRKTTGVEAVIPNVYKGVIMKYEDQSKTVILMEWICEILDIYQNDMGMKIAEGRWPAPGKREIVVGSLVPTDVFPGLKINTKSPSKAGSLKLSGF